MLLLPLSLPLSLLLLPRLPSLLPLLLPTKLHTTTAYEILELYLELVAVRATMIAQSKTIPGDMMEVCTCGGVIGLFRVFMVVYHMYGRKGCV